RLIVGCIAPGTLLVPQANRSAPYRMPVVAAQSSKIVWMNQVAKSNVVPFSKRPCPGSDNLRPLRKPTLAVISWGQDAGLRQQKPYFARKGECRLALTESPNRWLKTWSQPEGMQRTSCGVAHPRHSALQVESCEQVPMGLEFLRNFACR